MQQVHETVGRYVMKAMELGRVPRKTISPPAATAAVAAIDPNGQQPPITHPPSTDALSTGASFGLRLCRTG